MSGLALSPHGTLVVGVEDDPGGLAVRIYIGSRGRGRYFLVSDPDAMERARRAWAASFAGHLFADLEELRQLSPLLTETR